MTADKGNAEAALEKLTSWVMLPRYAQDVLFVQQFLEAAIATLPGNTKGSTMTADLWLSCLEKLHPGTSHVIEDYIVRCESVDWNALGTTILDALTKYVPGAAPFDKVLKDALDLLLPPQD